MKNIKLLIIVLSIMFIKNYSYAFYDFCQSPQEYNTFPASYDFRTEYWKDIPSYNTDKIHYNYGEKNNPTNRTLIKQSPEFKKNYEPEK